MAREVTNEFVGPIYSMPGRLSRDAYMKKHNNLGTIGQIKMIQKNSKISIKDQNEKRLDLPGVGNQGAPSPRQAQKLGRGLAALQNKKSSFTADQASNQSQRAPSDRSVRSRQNLQATRNSNSQLGMRDYQTSASNPQRGASTREVVAKDLNIHQEYGLNQKPKQSMFAANRFSINKQAFGSTGSGSMQKVDIIANFKYGGPNSRSNSRSSHQKQRFTSIDKYKSSSSLAKISLVKQDDQKVDSMKRAQTAFNTHAPTIQDDEGHYFRKNRIQQHLNSHYTRKLVVIEDKNKHLNPYQTVQTKNMKTSEVDVLRSTLNSTNLTFMQQRTSSAMGMGNGSAGFDPYRSLQKRDPRLLNGGSASSRMHTGNLDGTVDEINQKMQSLTSMRFGTAGATTSLKIISSLQRPDKVHNFLSGKSSGQR